MEKLSGCPDDDVEVHYLVGSERSSRVVSRLTAECGIYDNWPMFLKAGMEDTVDALRRHEMFSFRKTSHGETRATFDYVPGTVELQVVDSVWENMCAGSDEERAKQRGDYGVMLLFHPYLDRKMEGASNMRAMAAAIRDVAGYLQEKGIPACFPRSVGWRCKDDLSQIVYHDPG